MRSRGGRQKVDEDQWTEIFIISPETHIILSPCRPLVTWSMCFRLWVAWLLWYLGRFPSLDLNTHNWRYIFQKYTMNSWQPLNIFSPATARASYIWRQNDVNTINHNQWPVKTEMSSVMWHEIVVVGGGVGGGSNNIHDIEDWRIVGLKL